MEQLLSAFLIMNKYCPLPTAGTLRIEEQAAVSSITEKKIQAPKLFISFSEKETEATPLLQYIASASGKSISAASDDLSHYCSRLLQIQPYEKVGLGNLGNFSKNDLGEMHFENLADLDMYTPPVEAHRVIHPDAAHDMVVGDRSTNTVSMAEMLATEEKKKLPRWVWVAIVLAVAASAVIIINLLNDNSGSGSSSPVNAKEAPSTYKTGSE
jgi:hypothetical protein